MQFSFPDAPSGQREWWLVLSEQEVDVCDVDPGFDVAVSSSLRTLTSVWMGNLEWSAALRSGSLEIRGPEELRRAFPRWFTLSTFAGFPRTEPRLVG